MIWHNKNNLMMNFSVAVDDAEDRKERKQTSKKRERNRKAMENYEKGRKANDFIIEP